MALNLAIRQGAGVFVGEELVRVVSVEGTHEAVLEKTDGSLVTVTDQRQVELFPAVHVSIGRKNQPGHVGTASLVFEAPRSITILREEVRKGGTVRNPRTACV